MNKVLLGGVLVVVFVAGVVFPRTTTIVERVQQLGSQPGPDFSEPRISIGGTEFYNYTAPMTSRSATPCIFRAPNATSTLVYANADYRTGSSTAATTYLGVGTTPGTIVTTLVSQGLSAGAKGTINYNISSSTVMAPNSYVMVTLPGGTIANSPAGTCSAGFQVFSK